MDGQQAESAYATDVARLATLQSMIGEQLKADELQATIRSLVSSSSKDDEVKQLLTTSGLIDTLSERIAATLLTGAELGKPTGTAEPPPPSRGSVGSRARPGASTTTGPAHPAPLHTTLPGRPEGLYLLVHVVRGLAFLGLPDVAEDATTCLEVHLWHRHQRFSTRPVMSSTEPAFDTQWMIELHSTDTNILLQTAQPLRLLLTRLHLPTSTRTLLGVKDVDWRDALTGTAARPTLEIKEPGAEVDVTVGLLELRLELLGLRPAATLTTRGGGSSAAAAVIASDEVSQQLRRERRRSDEVTRLFYVYAKQWWADYLGMRDSHAQRLVKSIESPRIAARGLGWNV
ncbi:Centrosomal protein of 76 kDa [Irineochytrium annulatum]|nr:Centrosomal protein of 76 kDa [Irineochytrium annulatum]